MNDLVTAGRGEVSRDMTDAEIVKLFHGLISLD